jgi:hypothetical protein
MTTAPPGGAGMTGHELLLRLAGRINDDLLANTRRQLAGGDVRGAVITVANWLASERAPLLAGEVAAIRVLTADPGALSAVRPAPDFPELPFAFNEVDPFGEVERDAMDEAVAAVAEGHGAAGLWRSWRYRLDDPDAPEATVTVNPDDPEQAYRVYVVQVEQASVIPALSRDLLQAVDDSGRAGTEVILLGDEPPPYQDMALAESMLLWASQSGPEFELAAVFDFADPVSGPGFAIDHSVLDDPDDLEQVLAYLSSGVLVLATTATMDDVLDPDAGGVVPANFRTDGEWIWSDAVEYYLSRYRLAPEAGLDEHIRAKLSRGEIMPLVDEDTAGRAADFLLNPPPPDPQDAEAQEPVWFPGQSAAERAG